MVRVDLTLPFLAVTVLVAPYQVMSQNPNCHEEQEGRGIVDLRPHIGKSDFIPVDLHIEVSLSAVSESKECHGHEKRRTQKCGRKFLDSVFLL